MAMESDRAGAEAPQGAPQQRWPIAGPRLRLSQREEIAQFSAVRCPCCAASTCGRPQQRLRQLASMGARRRETWRRDCHGWPSRRTLERRSAADRAARRVQPMSCSQLREAAAMAPAGWPWWARRRDNRGGGALPVRKCTHGSGGSAARRAKVGSLEA